MSHKPDEPTLDFFSWKTAERHLKVFINFPFSCSQRSSLTWCAHASSLCQSSCLCPGLWGCSWMTGQVFWEVKGHRVWGQEKGTSHLCVYALSSQGLMTSIREESIPSRAISESRQNRETRCSKWVPDFCHRWRQKHRKKTLSAHCFISSYFLFVVVKGAQTI